MPIKINRMSSPDQPGQPGQPDQPADPSPGRPRRSLFSRLNLILVALLIISLLTAFYFYRLIKSDPQRYIAEEVESEVERLMAEVGELIELPADETPTVATVSDPEVLKSQPFFANAKAGYKVLIYTNAKKAILYDPVRQKIIEVAPINIGPTE